MNNKTLTITASPLLKLQKDALRLRKALQDIRDMRPLPTANKADMWMNRAETETIASAALKGD